MDGIFEVVSGQVLLSGREKFFALHSGVLLPMMRKVGITPTLFLFTEIGRYGRFLDIYSYPNMEEYDRRTTELLSMPEIEEYYRDIATTLFGGIMVELMRELPYSPGAASK